MTAQPITATAHALWFGTLVCTDHAARRLNQCGLRPDDVGVVLAHSEGVEDGCLLTQEALAEARSALKCERTATRPAVSGSATRVTEEDGHVDVFRRTALQPL